MRRITREHDKKSFIGPSFPNVNQHFPQTTLEKRTKNDAMQLKSRFDSDVCPRLSTSITNKMVFLWVLIVRFKIMQVHIEQGPVLESKGLPFGVVDAIAGQTRLRVSSYRLALP